jgi:hypothetical protein
MPKNKLSDLRDHLFEQLERLKDADAAAVTTEVERAHAMSHVAQTIISSAKLELRAAEQFGDDSAPAFFPAAQPGTKALRG